MAGYKQNGVSRYAFYKGTKGETLPFEDHRILPRPHHQGKVMTCVMHTCVNCLESLIRKKFNTEYERDLIPRLSVQHAIDGILDGKEPETGQRFGDVVGWIACYGVTDEAGYRFSGEVKKNKFKGGTVYHLADYVRRFKYSLDKKKNMDEILEHLEYIGPALGSYTEREGHKGVHHLEKKGEVVYLDEAKTKPCKHAILIIGHHVEWNEAERQATGYWLFMNSKGPNWGEEGCGTIQVDALDRVAGVYVNMDEYKKTI